MSYEDDKQAAVVALSKIDPTKPFGTELFNALCRLTVSVPIELVALRKSRLERLEVLLTWRDEKAPAYPNTWHCPGTFLRPAESLKEAIERLSQTEFGCLVKVAKQVDWYDNPDEERGHCLHLIFLVELLGETKGIWFPINKLPDSIVGHHREIIIPMAVNKF